MSSRERAGRFHIRSELGGRVDRERHIWACMENCAEFLARSCYYSHHINICIHRNAPIIVEDWICGVKECLIRKLDICLAHKVSKRFQACIMCKATSNIYWFYKFLRTRVRCGAENADSLWAVGCAICKQSELLVDWHRLALALIQNKLRDIVCPIGNERNYHSRGIVLAVDFEPSVCWRWCGKSDAWLGAVILDIDSGCVSLLVTCIGRMAGRQVDRICSRDAPKRISWSWKLTKRL